MDRQSHPDWTDENGVELSSYTRMLECEGCGLAEGSSGELTPEEFEEVLFVDILRDEAGQFEEEIKGFLNYAKGLILFYIEKLDTPCGNMPEAEAG
jgi:uncharacterized protein YifE (UPF0438 family)